MIIKSFRGQIADNSIQTVPLSTNNGSTGYRIKKLEGIPGLPGTESSESTVQIFKIEQSSVSTTAAEVNFSDNTMIGSAFYAKSAGVDNADKQVTIFDNEIFNQDIFVTHTDTASTQAVNYYIELEQIKLDITENTVATLKDIRNIEASSV